MISASLLLSLKDESFDDITDVMDMNLGKVWEMVRHREAWCAVSPRGQEELDMNWRLNNNLVSLQTVDFTGVSSIFFPPSWDGIWLLKCPGVDIFPPPGQLGSDNISID